MTIKEKLDAIKVLLTGLPAQAAAEPAETEPAGTVEQEKSMATAKDGTIVKWDGELAVGSEVMVTTPEGDKPAPDGAIEFEDGTIVTVVSGKVTQIDEPVPAMDMNEEFNKVKAENESLKSQIETLKADFSAHKLESTEQLHKLSKVVESTLDVVNEMNKTPEEPQPKPINALFKAVDNTDRFKELSEKIKSLRKN